MKLLLRTVAWWVDAVLQSCWPAEPGPSQDELDAAYEELDAALLAEREAEEEVAEPPAYYTVMTAEFASQKYGFPRPPRPAGVDHIASDGSRWRWGGNAKGDWEMVNYPPTGDPRARSGFRTAVFRDPDPEPFNQLTALVEDIRNLLSSFAPVEQPGVANETPRAGSRRSPRHRPGASKPRNWKQ